MIGQSKYGKGKRKATYTTTTISDSGYTLYKDKERKEKERKERKPTFTQGILCTRTRYLVTYPGHLEYRGTECGVNTEKPNLSLLQPV